MSPLFVFLLPNVPRHSRASCLSKKGPNIPDRPLAHITLRLPRELLHCFGSFRRSAFEPDNERINRPTCKQLSETAATTSTRKPSACKMFGSLIDLCTNGLS
ncbi:hypothetical protein HBI81_179380 [Parastagonospora nodorum]|nr:hypothetical protein HBI81_179380 [Parastagonospora nodorum]